MKISGFLTLLLTLSYFTGYAHFFRNYQIEDGLSHNSVWAVMQDRKGFMWFGTADGLNRFDGKTFKIFRKKQGDRFSIGSNFIHYIKEDSQGRLLVGTKQGLYLYDENKETFRRITLEEDNTSISTIYEDVEGNIWLTCYGHGLYQLDRGLRVKKHFMKTGRAGAIPSNFFWTMLQDNSGLLWLGSDGEGLIRFDPGSGEFLSFAKDKKAGISDRTIYSLFCDTDNNLWIGSAGSGLYRYSSRFDQTTCYLNNGTQQILNIKAITAYDEHALVMGSDKGLMLFNREQNTFQPINDNTSFDNLTDKSIFSITRDREGALWIGTYFGGVNYYSPYINRFSYYPSIQPSSSQKNIVSGFAENGNGEIWIGTHDAGLSLFNPVTGKFTQGPSSVGYHDIQKLLLDRDKLYISLNNNGLQRLDLRTKAVEKFTQLPSDSNSVSSRFVVTLFKSSRGLIYLGLPSGVTTLDPVTGKTKVLAAAAGMSVKDIVEDINGSIWFATHKHGLQRLTMDGNWTAYHQRNAGTDTLLHNNVNCLFYDSHHRLWVGTEGDGLNMLNIRTGSFEQSFTERSGLPSNIVHAITNDIDGHIWLSTSRGLAKIDPSTRSIRTFGYMEAVQKIRYNPNCAIRTSDNRLLFGGANGFTSFNPRALVDHLAKPTLVITGFQLFNKEVAPDSSSSPLQTSINNTKRLSLAYNQNSFSFDFVALSYISPNHNHYAYQLEGFDKDWNEVGSQNKAFYMNIPAGSYVFKVRAYNSDGLWSDLSTTITIEVARPFWFSNIMLALYFIAAATGLTYLVRWYNHRGERRNKEKIYLYKVAKEKEIYESKINFFTNIAHEIRTPLSLIVAPLETIIASNDGRKETQSNLKIIERNAHRLLNLVNQLLDFRKIEEDMFPFHLHEHDMINILHKVIDQYDELARQNNIPIRFQASPASLPWVVDAEAIYKIVSNLLSNALKHARREIQISAHVVNNELQITVTDDGTGIAAQYHERLFEPFFQIEDGDNPVKTGSGLGLSLSQLLARKHGGSIRVQSGAGMLTSFTLCLPAGTGTAVTVAAPVAIPPEPIALPVVTADTRLRLLLVEDNLELRSFLANQLAASFQIYEAENGRKALEILELETIDLIISDILMPEMNGLELCNAVKSNTAFSHIPLIILSAKTDTPTKVQGLNKGADVYLEKPFSMEQLVAQVNSIIENRNHIREKFIQSPLHYFKRQSKQTESSAFIEKLNETILAHVADFDFTIDSLSEQFMMSRSNFHKKIKHVTGVTPNDYIKLIRLNYSAQLLSTGKYKVNEVCYLAGFNTPSYFSKCFFEQFGKLPKDFMQALGEG